MTDSNAPFRKHLAAAHEHLQGVKAAADEHHTMMDEHLSAYREQVSETPTEDTQTEGY